MESQSSMSLTDFDRLVLSKYPYPIAVNYHRLLEAHSWAEKTRQAIRLFEYGLKIVTLTVLSQYAKHSSEIKSKDLDALLSEKLPRATLGVWKRMLFETMWAYQGRKHLLVAPEVYDVFWNTSYVPHRKRNEIEKPYDRIIHIRNELFHDGFEPTIESEWEKIGQEVIECLRQVLRQFSFIQSYSAIYLFHGNEGLYSFIPFVGNQLTNISHTFHVEQQLLQDHVYLTKDFENFLLLHPLIIFWSDYADSQSIDTLQSDLALFSSLTKKTGLYSATVLRKIVRDPSTFEDLIDLFQKFGKRKNPLDTLPQHTWQSLQDTARVIAGRRFEDNRLSSRSKYDRQLYLQRSEVKDAFEEFLYSNKRVFLILGKSGVGKSNFILSLSDEFEAQDTICLLYYDGAKLQSTQSLMDVIWHDLELTQTTHEFGSRNFLDEVAQLPDIDHCKMILLVDAINENEDSRALLQQIDDLAQNNEYPWFKIVISSRPEAWRAMKRGVKLTEHLYYKRSNDLGIEITPFSTDTQQVGVSMKRFSRDELAIVYEKYRQAFNLNTCFTELSYTIRQILNDPLTLRIVAETYHDGSIPLFKPGKIYQDYINRLISDGRLSRADIRLLEHDLMPLMLSENGDFSKAITAEQVSSEATENGRPLFDLIFNDDLLPNQRRVNQSFINLVDGEILVLRESSPLEYEIGFKFERFYDYFAGKRLHVVSEKKLNRLAFFKDAINQTFNKPFLWGAVKTALLEEINTHGTDIALSLCFTDKQRERDMMVSVLEDLGRDDLELLNRILRLLIPHDRKRFNFERILGQLRPRDYVDSISSRNAKKIAVEVASKLGQHWLLREAALSVNPDIRASSVRWLYHLWKRDEEGRSNGFTVLKYLSEQIFGSLVPNPDAIESALGFTFIIFFDFPTDIPVLRQLQAIWKPVIAQIFRFNELDHLLKRTFKQFATNAIINLLIRLVFRLFGEVAQGAFVTLPNLEAFFRGSLSEKQLYERVAKSIDIQDTNLTAQATKDFLNIVNYRSMLTASVCAMAVTAQYTKNPSLMNNLVREMHRLAVASSQPNLHVSLLTGVAIPTLEHNPSNDEAFELFRDLLVITGPYMAKYSVVSDGSYNSTSSGGGGDWLGPYLIVNYKRTGSVYSDWLMNRINSATSNSNLAFYKDFINEIRAVGIDSREPRAALDSLALFFNSGWSEVDTMAQKFLSRLRVHYPDEVDDFLDQQRISDDYRTQVRVQEPQETIGELIGTRSWGFFRDNVILGSADLRKRLIAVLVMAAYCSNAREWINYAIREVVNLVYGSEVIPQVHKSMANTNGAVSE